MQDKGRDHYRTDGVTLSLMKRLLPEHQADLCRRFGDATPLNAEFGPYPSSDDRIDFVSFHAWSGRRIVARAVFASGNQYTDGTIAIRDALPDTVIQALGGEPAFPQADHPCFEGVRFSMEQGEIPTLLRLDVTADVDLGPEPGSRLAALLARADA